MIHISRRRVAAPSVLGQPAAKALAELREHYGMGEVYRSQRRYEFDSSLWGGREVRRALADLFHNKCAFCECKLKALHALEIAHFRPREKATGIQKGSVAPDHYWWLAYSWDNLYPICRDCHRYKRNSFPVDRARAEPESAGSELKRERPLLLDPCADEPEADLEYSRFGRIRGSTLRAEVTIGVLGLNRPGLVEQRRKYYVGLADRAAAWNAQVRALERGSDAWRKRVDVLFRQVYPKVVERAEFAGLKRQLVRRTLERLGLGEGDAPPELDLPAKLLGRRHQPIRVSKRERERRKRVLAKLQSTWITSIEIKNFKGIHELEFDFPPAQTGRDPWVMLLGTNGVGKSSILKAIALALMTSPKRREILVPDASSYMNHCTDEPNGHVFVHLNNGHSVELHFSRFGKKFKQRGGVPELKILGFGSTRLPPPLRPRTRRAPCAKQRRRRTQWVDNLFDPHRPLGDPEIWLTDPKCLPTGRFNPLKPALRELLGLGVEVGLSRRRGALYVHQFGGSYSLRESSDGYQTVVTLATEIIRNLSVSGRSADDVEGTVLLDEIEAHLHPIWKVRIVATLRRIFPHVRFIVTTHDPLCLRGLEEDEICLLTRDAEGLVRSRALSVPPGLRTDQLLTGEWFGLGTTLDDETFELMQQHWHLLLKRGKTAADRRRQHALESRIRERTGTYMETDLSRMGWTAVARHMPEKPRALAFEDRKALTRKLVDYMDSKRKRA